MQQKTLPKSGQSSKMKQTAVMNAPKSLHPEDDWELTGNPTIYLDQLPQPYRFINSCLDLLIMKPVFNKITLIEEKKKTPEYEGYLKEIQATGFMEQEGITTMTSTSVAITAGGSIEKEGNNYISNKVILGDKFGYVHLFDASRKLMLDKKHLFDAGRRIQNISSATVNWMDTKLTYVSVIARASPIVKVLIFKHNENKFYHIYNLNVCPQLPNPDTLEQNPDQSYLELPSECKYSLEGSFLCVTSFNGEVKLLKMPPIINPLRDDEVPQSQQQQPPQPGAKGQPPVQQQNLLQTNQSLSNLDEKTQLKPEIDNISLQTLELPQVLITKIESRKEQKFKDPFVFKQGQEGEEHQPSLAEQQHASQASILYQAAPNFKYVLGTERPKDNDGGDAGQILKRQKMYPQVFFIRSKYCSKPIGQTDPVSARQIKEYYITTGLLIAYLNQFDIQIYNIQKPSKDNVHGDYTQEYFNKLIISRKLNAKKKNEKTLTQLIKTVRQKEEGVTNSKSAQDQEMVLLRESMQKPVRTFKMPYSISSVAYQGQLDNYQALAVGLVDGAVIILDLILGIERSFLEKHPAEISALAFWDDKVLISGSIDGRVNLNDLEDESETSKINRCQNCQDRKVPIVRAFTSNYGIGAVVDIEGNCRFYDLIRFRKIAKLNSLNQRGDADSRFIQHKCKWRLLPHVTMESTSEVFLAITQTPDLIISEDQQKSGKMISEKDVLIDKKYSDEREKLKSVPNISFDMPEVNFYVQKSTMCIFRFEDVLFNLYPHIASMRRKGMTVREIFQKNDPNKESFIAANNTHLQGNNMLGTINEKPPMDLSSQPENSRRQFGLTKSVISGQSGGKKSDNQMHSVNFNLGASKDNPSGDSSQPQQYDIPTLKRLNPELYKEISKQTKQMQDPILLSQQNLKERYGYHEMRQQRIQKRTEEVAKELEAKNEEQILKNRKKNMRNTEKKQ